MKLTRPGDISHTVSMQASHSQCTQLPLLIETHCTSELADASYDSFREIHVQERAARSTYRTCSDKLKLSGMGPVAEKRSTLSILQPMLDVALA